MEFSSFKISTVFLSVLLNSAISENLFTIPQRKELAHSNIEIDYDKLNPVIINFETTRDNNFQLDKYKYEQTENDELPENNLHVIKAILRSKNRAHIAKRSPETEQSLDRIDKGQYDYESPSTNFTDYGGEQEDVKLIDIHEDAEQDSINNKENSVPVQYLETSSPLSTSTTFLSYFSTSTQSQKIENNRDDLFTVPHKPSPSVSPKRKQIPRKRYESVTTEPEINDKELMEKELRKQAESARYSFATSFQNSINDNSHEREEVRDGLRVMGHYSYSDGYYKRTVHYVADENGYRIVKENVESLGDGPVEDINGTATVNVVFNNQNPLKYSYTGAELRHNRTRDNATDI